MENKNKKNRVLPQMFDVRPVKETGDLDLEKIQNINKVLRLEKREAEKKILPENQGAAFSDIRQPSITEQEAQRFQKILEDERRADVYQLGRTFQSDHVPVLYEIEPDSKVSTRNISPAPKKEPIVIRQNKASENAFSFGRLWKAGRVRRPTFSFSSLAVAIFLAIFAITLWNHGIRIKSLVTDKGQVAYADLTMAKSDILAKNFQESSFRFSQAYDKFSEISKEINDLGGILVGPARFVPFVSKLSSGSYMAQAGKDISQVGILAGQVAQSMDKIKNPLKDANDANASVSFLKIFQDTDKNLKQIATLLADAQDNLDKINLDDIPEAQRAQFVNLKDQLPGISDFLNAFLDNSRVFTDILGGDGPRKYLFLFQNNQEMRATGGFIGTYGLMDISNGRIRKFFIDGIYNPDGQLKEKVVPPIPIQKISAAWSLHDSNWFPDFPVSAEKAAWFFEKDGGPTVDGVITMTPEVMQKLLAVTGPIDMPEYNMTIDQNNFEDAVQQEVEVDYDKTQNQPKKIIADLAPKILDKIFNAKDFATMAKTMDVLMESLKEKQILIYSRNYNIEKILSEEGWSGEILDAPKDYISVINTNINGYKTDGVIDESINHKADIQPDGSVIDTVTITRHHNGGNSQYDWYNKVNADYMRVYVPKGSQLISAEGQTREFDSPPLDYDALGFKRDPQVQSEEDSTHVDEESGTRIYDDANKTVFANWAYVSPQETVVVKYKYLLPFKIFSDSKIADTYSLVAQKQSGSIGSKLETEVDYPANCKVNWKYPDSSKQGGNTIKLDTDLVTDKFTGMEFVKQ